MQTVELHVSDQGVYVTIGSKDSRPIPLETNAGAVSGPVQVKVVNGLKNKALLKMSADTKCTVPARKRDMTE